LTGRYQPKLTSKSESQITSACLVSFLIPNAPAFDVSNSARRRLRIPSVFTISKSKLPCGRPCGRDERTYRVDPVTFVSALAAKEAPYSPGSPACQTLIFTFFAHAIKGMGEPED
jgi:hypothetical protein